MISRLLFKLAAWFFAAGVFVKVLGIALIIVLAAIIWLLW